jgi:hypothetical protein
MSDFMSASPCGRANRVLSTSTLYLSAGGDGDRHRAPPIAPAIAIAIAKNKSGDHAARASRARRFTASWLTGEAA